MKTKICECCMASFVSSKKRARFCPECQRGIDIANAALKKMMLEENKKKAKKKMITKFKQGGKTK